MFLAEKNDAEKKERIQKKKRTKRKSKIQNGNGKEKRKLNPSTQKWISNRY